MRATMVLRCLLLVLLIIIGAGCGKKGKEGKAEMAFPDSIVDSELIVTVNDYPISGRELKLFASMFNQVNINQFPDSTFNQIILDKMIDRILIYKEAASSGVALDESTSNVIMSRFIANIGGEEALNNFLDAKKFERKEVMESLRKDLLINHFIEEKFSEEANIDEKDAREYYDNNIQQFELPDSVRARHILLRVTPDDSKLSRQQKRTSIAAILERARAGEDFAELAKHYSDDPSSIRGGDLGFFARKTMVAPFDSVAFSLDVGGLSDVVETPFGYHIIKIEEKRKGASLKFDDIKNNLMAKLWEFKIAGILQKHLIEIRQTANIKRYY